VVQREGPQRYEAPPGLSRHAPYFLGRQLLPRQVGPGGQKLIRVQKVEETQSRYTKLFKINHNPLSHPLTPSSPLPPEPPHPLITTSPPTLFCGSISLSMTT